MPHLLIYGDSNSHGTRPMRGHKDEGRLGDEARWPGVLSALAADWTVTLEALPGRTTVLDDPIEGAWKNGLTVLPAVLQSHVPLDVVAIMLGSNDLKARFGLSAGEVADGAGRLLDTVAWMLPGVARLLICPPVPHAAGPGAEVFAGAGERGARLPERMSHVAAARGAAYFDANAVIGVSAVDGVHFDAHAHAALGRALVPVVRGLA